MDGPDGLELIQPKEVMHDLVDLDIPSELDSNDPRDEQHVDDVEFDATLAKRWTLNMQTEVIIGFSCVTWSCLILNSMLQEKQSLKRHASDISIEPVIELQIEQNTIDLVKERYISGMLAASADEALSFVKELQKEIEEKENIIDDLRKQSQEKDARLVKQLKVILEHIKWLDLDLLLLFLAGTKIR